MESPKNTSRTISRENEKGLMENIQGDIPLASRPFLEISRNIGASESEVIAAIRKLKEDKVIRRFGAIIRHQKAGFLENAILIVSAGEENPERIGQQLASFQEISHCYQREPQFMGRYGIFAMLHARRGQLEGLVKKIAARTGIRDYLVLKSAVEFKKTSLEPA